MEDDDRFVTVTRTPDIAAAQLIRGYLEAAGISARIPDEYMASQVGFVTHALGGIRIEVHAADREAALACLADLPEREQGDQEDASPADRLAQRALRTALVGFFAVPFVHPYAFILAWRALREPDLTRTGRRQAWVAASVSVTVVVGAVVLLASLFLR